MCECGCLILNPSAKISLGDGAILLVDIYPSCENCLAPVGLRFYKVEADDPYMNHWEDVPDLTFGNKGMAYLQILGRDEFKEMLRPHLVGATGGDSIMADIIHEDVMKDLRGAVIKSCG